MEAFIPAWKNFTCIYFIHADLWATKRTLLDTQCLSSSCCSACIFTALLAVMDRWSTEEKWKVLWKMLPCMFVILISALIHRQINWDCLSVTVNTTYIFLCVVTNNAFLYFPLQSGRKFQDLILVDIWLVWSNLCCPQIRSQVHWEHWLCSLWHIQRHNGGGSAQHADCYDQQFISRNWGGLCSQAVLFCYAEKRAELMGITSAICKKYKEEITTGKDITKCIK